ncbi:MAG: hypothetical protein KJ955_04525 [Nanoarchaeota archaeon]|nr:hypothetical protein [Nanoarchaeota archaeon]
MDTSKKIGIALLGAATYIGLGGLYQVHKFGTTHSRGHNNRQVNREFLEEFDEEARSLEQRLLAKNKECGIEISTDIIVHSRLKSFFDDNGNPNDNSEWTNEVEEALEGLNIYKGLGICFNYEHIIPVYENVLMYGPSLEADDILNSPLLTRHVLLMEDKDPEKTLKKAYYFYRLAGVEQEAVFGFTAHYDGTSSFGKAHWNGSHALVLLSNDTDYNSIVTAHEAGHLFGLDDLEESSWVVNLVLDPFHLFTNLMKQGLTSFSLEKWQIEEIIKNARQRFE